MTLWTKHNDAFRLELAPNQYLEIYSEDGGKTWHCSLTSLGEGLALFFSEPSVEDAKIRAAIVLREFSVIALKASFK